MSTTRLKVWSEHVFAFVDADNVYECSKCGLREMTLRLPDGEAALFYERNQIKFTRAPGCDPRMKPPERLRLPRRRP